MCRRTGRNGIYIFETTIARRFANRRGPILPDERRADGRRELRRARILKQGRGQGIQSEGQALRYIYTIYTPNG
jgi:hypothetical protein